MPTIRRYHASTSHRTVVLSDGQSFAFPHWSDVRHHATASYVATRSNDTPLARHNQQLLSRARELCTLMAWSWPRTLASTLALVQTNAEEVL